MLFAVVGDGRAVLGDGDGDLLGDRVDLERTVHDHEFDVREVGVDVLKIFRLDADRVFARVGALRRPGGSLGRLDALGRIVEIVVGRHGDVAIDGVLRAVIGDGIAVLGNGDGDLIGDRVDLELAVHDHELNVREVGVDVLKIFRLDADRVFARVGALRRPGGGLGRLDTGGHVVEIVIRRYGLVALHGVFLAVIGDGIAVLDDGDGDLIADRVDLEPAVHNDDFDIAVVAGGDDEVFLRQTHRVGAGVGARHSRLAAQLNGDRIVGHVGGVALGDVLVAVIGEGSGVAPDGYDDLIGDRGDLQLAVVRGGNDVASGRVHHADGAVCEVCRVLAHVGARRADGDGREAGLDLRAVDLFLTGNREAAHGPLGAVVDMGGAVRRQLEILIVEELDHVPALVRAHGELLRRRAHGRVALDGLGRFGDLGADLRRVGLALGHFNERAVLVLVVVPVVVDNVLVGIVQLVVIALDVLAPIAERDIRNVGQGAFGLLNSLLHVLGRHGVLRVHDHRAARRDGGNRRGVAVLAHRVARAGQELRHGVGHDDVFGLGVAHVLHRDGVGDRVANVVVGLGSRRGLLLGIERVVARDRQGAVFLLDCVVRRHIALGVGDRCTGDLRDRRVNADQRLLILVVVQHGHIQGVAREQSSVAVRRFDGAADNAVCRVRHGARVVVGVFQLSGGDLHGALIDDQLAVVHNELDVREVRAVVREVRFLQTHRVGVRVGARCRIGAAEGEVRFLIEFVADAHIVAGDGMLRAVIRHGGFVARDCHDHFVLHRRDGQLARRLGNGVVLRNVRAGGVKDLHGAAERAGVLTLLSALGHVGQVLVGMASQQAGRRDAVDALLGAVVDSLRTLAGEGHGILRVGDDERAGRLGHDIVLRNVVAAGVFNDHVAGERAFMAADILALRLVGQARVGVVFHKAAIRDAVDALHAAVVGEGLALAGEGHGARLDSQRADHGHAEGVVIGHILFCAVHRADDAVAVDRVIAGAHVGLLAAGRVCYLKRIARHQRAGVGVLMIRQRRAVVDRLSGRRGDGDGIARPRGDGELALVLDDGVVALLEVRAGGEGDGVLYLTLGHVGHAAGGLDIGHFAGDKAFPAGDVRTGERRAVVGLARRFGRQGHGAPVNGELAVRHNECDLAEVRVCILEARGREAHGVIVCVGAFRMGACVLSKAEIFRLIQAVRNALDLVAIDAVLFAVIGGGIGAAGDGDGDFLLGRRDGQRAVHDHEFNVREVRVGVLEVAGLDADIVRADIDARRRPCGHLGRLDTGGHVVEIVIRRHGLVALHGVFLAVIGDGIAVLGDGDGDLIGDRVDRERAVHDHELDVREVLIDVLKVVRLDADRVRAHVDALRRPGVGARLGDARLDIVEIVIRRHGLIAVDGVLFAVVGGAAGFLGDGDGDLRGDLVDRQHAGLVFYGVVAGQGGLSVSAVGNGVLVNDVELRAGVGDGALRRHEEGEVFLRVAVDETGDVKARLRERRAVVGLARVLCLERQGDGVINGDDVLRHIRLNGDAVGGIIVFHDSRRIALIQSVRLARRQGFVDGLGAGLVVGNLHGRAEQIVVDGIAGGVELEVQLQHRGAVAGERRRFDVGRGGVKRILAVLLVRLVLGGDGDGGAGRGETGGSIFRRSGIRFAVVQLIIELDDVFGVLVRRPDGIEVVIAAVNIVHHGLSAGAEQGAGAIRLRVPAGERIAGAGERLVAQKRHARVVDERAFVLLGLIRAEVGVVGQRHGGDLVAPDGVERDLGRNLNLAAGVIHRSRAIVLCVPAEEHLARGRRQPRRGLHVRVSVLRVGLGVRGRGAHAAVGVIDHRESFDIDIVGIERDILVDFLVEVEGLIAFSFFGAPAHKYPLAGCFGRLMRRQIVLRDLSAIRNSFQRFGSVAVHADVDFAVYRGRRPVGVDHDIVVGHGAAEGMLMSLGAGGVIVPAAKGIVSLAVRRRGRIAHFGDILLKLFRD